MLTDVDSTPNNDDGDQSEDDEDQCAKIMVSVDPVIDLELIKLVNGQDANDMASAVTVMPGDVVTWTITTTVTTPPAMERQPA